MAVKQDALRYSDKTPYMCGLLIQFAHGTIDCDELVYYRGKFGQDMQACEHDIKKPSEGAAPRYRSILAQIQRTADKLAKEGKIALSTRPAKRKAKKGAAEFTEYVAVRIA